MITPIPPSAMGGQVDSPPSVHDAAAADQEVMHAAMQPDADGMGRLQGFSSVGVIECPETLLVLPISG